MTFESKDDQDPLDHVVVPLHEEQVSIGKHKAVIDRVKVSTVREELVEQLLRKERVDIERVPIGQVVQEVPQFHIPQVREEGDVTIIPVVEEKVFVERRLVLKEVRRPSHETQNYQECVVLRRLEAVITRVPATETTSHAIGWNITPPEREEI
jgi:stress response protein YsnF